MRAKVITLMSSVNENTRALFFEDTNTYAPIKGWYTYISPIHIQLRNGHNELLHGYILTPKHILDPNEYYKEYHWKWVNEIELRAKDGYIQMDYSNLEVARSFLEYYKVPNIDYRPDDIIRVRKTVSNLQDIKNIYSTRPSPSSGEYDFYKNMYDWVRTEKLNPLFRIISTDRPDDLILVESLEDDNIIFEISKNMIFKSFGCIRNGMYKYIISK